MSNLHSVEEYILLEKIKAFTEIINSLKETGVKQEHVTELLALKCAINAKIFAKSGISFTA